MSLLGAAGLLLAIVGLLLLIARARTKGLHQVGNGLRLWGIYGAGVILVALVHVMQLGDPFRGWNLLLAIFGPYVLGLGAMCSLVWSLLTFSQSQSSASNDKALDIACASSVLVLVAIHHFAVGLGPWP